MRKIASIPPIPARLGLLWCLLFVITGSCVDSHAQKTSHKKTKSSTQAPAMQATVPDEISGMYSFLREGEFVQITVENGKLSGFVSRYGELDSDRGVFLDQFFTRTALKGDALSFTTKSVHGTWF